MEPGNSTEAHNLDYEKYRELKEELNKAMVIWTDLSQDVEAFLEENN